MKVKGVNWLALSAKEKAFLLEVAVTQNWMGRVV